MSNWKITYVGEGVTALDGVGVFARHTTARVAEGVATKLKGDSKWLVTSPEGATTGTAPKAEKPPEPKAEAKKEEPKKEEPKAEAKKEEPKKEEPKAEAKKEEPRKEEPKAEAKKEEPKKEEKPAEKK